MTVGEALKKGIKTLKECTIDTPVLDAGVILCHVLGKDKTYLFAHDDDIIDLQKEETYLDFIHQRALRKPLQYITGCQEFMSLEFYVNENVLIPRADTEILVEDIIKHAGNESDVINILDIGTGSGCIAVSLAYYMKGCRVTAMDVSPGALEVARENAERHGVSDKIRFLQGDIMKGVVFTEGNGILFDTIVSNPPYIVSGDISGLQVEVGKYEPVTALDGGKDGLDFYRVIAGYAEEHLKPGGTLAFEVGYGQSDMVAEMMRNEFANIRIIKDYGGVERVVAGVRRQRL